MDNYIPTSRAPRWACSYTKRPKVIRHLELTAVIVRAVRCVPRIVIGSTVEVVWSNVTAPEPFVNLRLIPSLAKRKFAARARRNSEGRGDRLAGNPGFRYFQRRARRPVTVKFGVRVTFWPTAPIWQVDPFDHRSITVPENVAVPTVQLLKVRVITPALHVSNPPVTRHEVASAEESRRREIVRKKTPARNRVP